MRTLAWLLRCLLILMLGFAPGMRVVSTLAAQEEQTECREGDDGAHHRHTTPLSAPGKARSVRHRPVSSVLAVASGGMQVQRAVERSRMPRRTVPRGEDPPEEPVMPA
ncbi:MAG: hypothetical protein AB2A00_15625 [Myxococcota bacterium]